MSTDYNNRPLIIPITYVCEYYFNASIPAPNPFDTYSTCLVFTLVSKFFFFNIEQIVLKNIYIFVVPVKRKIKYIYTKYATKVYKVATIFYKI